MATTTNTKAIPWLVFEQKHSIKSCHIVKLIIKILERLENKTNMPMLHFIWKKILFLKVHSMSSNLKSSAKYSTIYKDVQNTFDNQKAQKSCCLSRPIGFKYVIFCINWIFTKAHFQWVVCITVHYHLPTVF